MIDEKRKSNNDCKEEIGKENKWKETMKETSRNRCFKDTSDNKTKALNSSGTQTGQSKWGENVFSPPSCFPAYFEPAPSKDFKIFRNKHKTGQKSAINCKKALSTRNPTRIRWAQSSVNCFIPSQCLRCSVCCVCIQTNIRCLCLQPSMAVEWSRRRTLAHCLWVCESCEILEFEQSRHK